MSLPLGQSFSDTDATDQCQDRSTSFDVENSPSECPVTESVETSHPSRISTYLTNTDVQVMEDILVDARASWDFQGNPVMLQQLRMAQAAISSAAQLSSSSDSESKPKLKEDGSDFLFPGNVKDLLPSLMEKLHRPALSSSNSPEKSPLPATSPIPFAEMTSDQSESHSNDTSLDIPPDIVIQREYDDQEKEAGSTIVRYMKWFLFRLRSRKKGSLFLMLSILHCSLIS